MYSGDTSQDLCFIFFNVLMLMCGLTVDFSFFCCSDKEEDLDGEGVEADVETAQEKRLRLAKQYLAQLESEGTDAS